MLNLTAFAALMLALLYAPAANAAVDCVGRYMPGAHEVGRGEGRRFIFHAYDAQLLAPQGTFARNKPFALTLTYRMQFSGKDIARESAAQMRRMAAGSERDIDRWYQEMQFIFPDVQPGLSITGLRLKNKTTVFCTGDTEIGRIADPAFADAFFSIWLGDHAENAHLRQQLIGQP